MDYVEKLSEYVKNPNEERIKRLEKRLALVLRKRDTSTVSATDEKEVQRAVAWVQKACGASKDEAEGAVHKTLDQMKGDRSKNRLVVYYLAADHLGKLDQL